MAAFEFPLSTMPGARAQESAGRLINCYAEVLGEGARWRATRRRVPGLASFATTAATLPFRGMIQVGGVLYSIFKDEVWSSTSGGGAAVLHDTFSGEEKCFIAKNNNATPDVVVVEPGTGVSVITGAGVSSYPDSDVGSPTSVCFVDGYFFFSYGDGKIRSSGINTTAIDTLDFVTAEMKPDSLLRVVAFNNQLLAFGTESVEFWSGNPVNDTGFPFNRVTGKPRGLAGRYAVAGYEDGFGSALVIVGNDNGVHMLSGYDWNKISPPDLDRLIERTSDKNTIEASCYVSEGRNVVVLSGPDWTWEFNLNTLKWNERQSYLAKRWRGTQSYFAFGKWITGDTNTNKILHITTSARDEDSQPLRSRIESGAITKFPQRAIMSRVDIDITTGQGIATDPDGQDVDPTVEITISPDGGATWPPPRLVRIGKQAIYDQRIYATRFGISGVQGPRVRIDITDAIDFGVMGGDLTGSERQP